MFYPASDIIAADHPDLVTEVEWLDRLLAHSFGDCVRIDRAADSVGLTPSQTESLLDAYGRAGVVERRMGRRCLRCDALVERGAETECDLCEERVPLEPRTEIIVFRVTQAPTTSPVQTPVAGDLGVQETGHRAPVIIHAENIGTVHIGNQYGTESVVSQGPGARVTRVDFGQLWIQSKSTIDLSRLAEELEVLLTHVQAQPKTSEQEAALAAILNAKEAARKRRGAKTLEHLSKAGKWALDAATTVGTALAAEVLKKTLGLSP